MTIDLGHPRVTDSGPRGAADGARVEAEVTPPRPLICVNTRMLRLFLQGPRSCARTRPRQAGLAPRPPMH
jgi:hypothetical protein